jgi:acetylornithine deacetylase/succinyl-diaminopimelate desuccinylase-like protein
VNETLVRAILGAVDESLAVEVTRGMVRIPSVCGDELAIAEHLERTLRGFGMGAVWTQAVEPKRPNVLWKVGGDRPGPTFLFTGHLDTKPVCEGWTGDPYSGELSDGRIHGHGVMDMKAGLGAQIAAVHALARAGLPLRGSLYFAAVSDHMGQQRGAIKLFEGFPVDMCVLGEISDNQITICHRGRYYFDIDTIGRSAHTCHKDRAVNAVEKMMPIVQKISALRYVPPKLDPRIRELVGAELYTAVGRIYGGLFPGGPSMIPDRCTIRVDTRPQPGIEVEEVQALLERAIAEAVAEDPSIKAEIRLADRKDYFLVDPAAPVVQMVTRAWTRVMGRTPEYKGVSWLGDTASFGRRIPTVIFGPGREPVYMPDEYLDMHDLMAAARVNALAAAIALVPEIEG